MMRPAHLTRRSMALLLASAAVFPTAGSLSAQETFVVAAVNYPLAFFAERLVGDTAEVLFAVPAGTDPSFWRPSIAEITAMQTADMIALNGAGFANWTTKVSLPRSRTVDTSAGFSDRYISTETVTHSHGDGGQHSHTGTANYIWLDFELAALQAEALAAGLIRRRPESEATIASNLESLARDLSALATSAKEIEAQATGKTAIAAHPRYQYFGQAYGLNIASMEWDANEDVSDAQWQDLQAKIAETGAELFIWEATPTQKTRDRIRELGLTDVVFPPLANTPETGDFLSAMTASVEEIKRALSK